MDHTYLGPCTQQQNLEYLNQRCAAGEIEVKSASLVLLGDRDPFDTLSFSSLPKDWCRLVRSTPGLWCTEDPKHTRVDSVADVVTLTTHWVERRPSHARNVPLNSIEMSMVPEAYF